MNHLYPRTGSGRSRITRIFVRNKLAFSPAWMAVLWIVLLLTACGAPERTEVSKPATTPADQAQAVETIVAATLAARSQPSPTSTTLPETIAASPTIAPSPTATSTPLPSPTGTITSVSGKVCYRTRQIPAMTAYFESTQDQQVTTLPIPAGQPTYTVSLKPGTYLAYAWLPDFSLGGLYSKAVLCGLKVGCSDHAAVPFTLTAGEQLKGIDLCDWYAFNVPLPPDKQSGDVRGAVEGQISFPGGSIPSMKVVAFNQASGYWYYTVTNPGASAFRLADLPPGSYLVVGYTENGQAGGHADTSHNLLPVTVKPGETTRGVDLADWNAPAGAFPTDPTK